MLRVVAAGIMVVGVTFGMARYGYGLFVPDLRAEFGLSTEVVGLLATGSTAVYLVATVFVPFLTARGGPRLPVVLGGLVAAVGTLTVALAEGLTALAVGVIVAGASPALALPPFSDAVARLVVPGRRDRALTLISSGTSYGVLVAGPIALLAGGAWRAAWFAFAALALVAAALNARVLAAGERGRAPKPWVATLRSRRARSLLGAGFLVGVGIAVYFTFAVDLVVGAGSLPRSAGPALLVAIGVAGIAGGLAGDLVARIGLRRALWVTEAALALALVLLPLAPASGPVVGVSALLFGVGFIALTGVLAIWSARAFPERPDAGLAAMLFLLFVGQLLGPAAAGLIGGSYGLAPAFYLSALLVAAMSLLRPGRELEAADQPFRPRKPPDDGWR